MQFNVILQYHDELLRGLWLTVQLSLASIVLGTALGIAAASIRQTGGRAVRVAIDVYVEVVAQHAVPHPALHHLLRLPAMGLRIGATSAALIAMTLNLGAYSTEIVRAGIESIHRSQIEAGEALGLTRLQIYRHVVLVPAVAKVWPSLCSQFVLMMLASSVTSAISTQDLAAAAALIESQTFRSFEIYIVVTLVYLALALGLRGLLARAGRLDVRRGAPRGRPCSPPPRDGRGSMIRSFGLNDFLFLLEAAQWTLALTLIALIGGGIAGFAIALLRVGEERLGARRGAGLHPGHPGHPGADAALPLLLRPEPGRARAAAALRRRPVDVDLCQRLPGRDLARRDPVGAAPAVGGLGLPRDDQAPAVPLRHPAAGGAHLACRRRSGSWCSSSRTRRSPRSSASSSWRGPGS